MSEKFTEIICSPSGGGIGEWGWVNPGDAIERLRLHYERELSLAQRALADIAEGRVEVFHQYSPEGRRDRRRVYPAGPARRTTT